MKKGFASIIILFGIALIVLIGGVVVYQKVLAPQTQSTPTSIISPTPSILQPSPTPDPTANWKTYIDSDILKISLKYPTDWTVEFEAHVGKDAPAFSSPCNYDAGQRCSNLDLHMESYEKDKSLESYFNFDLTSQWPDNVIKKENIKIGGEDALAIEYLQGNYFYGSGANDHGLVLITAKVIHNQQVYSLSFSEVGKDRAQIKTSADWRNKQILGQILSTFKFLD